MTDDEREALIQRVVQKDAQRRQAIRERHDREVKARVGKHVGISRETCRKLMIANDAFSREFLDSGLSISKLYDLAVGDERVGLYVKIPPDVKEAAKDAAEERGETLAEYITDLIRCDVTHICG